jgi:hypothetical protein
MDFDTTANVLGIEIKEDWPPQTQQMMRDNQARLQAGLLARYGGAGFDRKIARIRELGISPFSLIAFHNEFLRQTRDAYVMGYHYPALAGACALGERVLNHLVLKLRDHYDHTEEYKDVYRKDSFDNWSVPIRVLSRWGVLLPNAAELFEKLKEVRNRSLHFDPATDTDAPEQALMAIRLLQEIVKEQFATFGPQPWFIPVTAGVSFVRKEHEKTPFVERIVLPNCVLVGPDHEMRLTPQGWQVIDHPYGDGSEVTDDEFLRLQAEAQAARAAAAAATRPQR